MKSLLLQLHERFCQELNELWLEAIFGNDGLAFTSARFDKLVSKISEAKKDGYTFLHEYAPEYILNKQMEDQDLNEALYCQPKWEQVKIINRIIEEVRQKNGESVIPHYEALRGRLIKEMIQEYASSYAKEKGPFYINKKTDCIYVYGNTGSVAHDMVLLTLVYAEKSINDTKSDKAKH